MEIPQEGKYVCKLNARAAVAKAVPAVEPVGASEGDGAKNSEPKRKDQRGKVA